ncbi:MAG: GldG family protein [Spirochaetaceae bacterium]|jgi:ABC-type uncharacterized transport system involved in gliding motility auxiliary subunit|nr:GldG family protein [Spirochaetaceae bacterium]
MKRKEALVLTVLVTASLVLCLLISRRLWFRLDLTAAKAFTISPVSRNLYAEIEDQVRITYFISAKLKSIHPIPGEVEDLLREYAARSRGKITIHVKDPVKSNMAETMEQLGIQGQPLETVEQDQASVAMVYSGILIEYLDKIEVLPLVFSLDTLEYDLTSRIRAMVRGSTREAGILVGDAGRSLADDYSYFNETIIRAGYRVRTINPGEEISPLLPVLIVLGGAAELDEWALYRIEYYLRGGGKVLFALEGVNTDARYTLTAEPAADKGLLAMVSFYGASVRPVLALDVSSQTIPLTVQGPGGYPQYQLMRYPFWIAALDQFAAAGHPVVSGFSGADLFWASPLELNPPEGVEAETLFSTTPEAWLQTQNFYLDPNQSFYFTMEKDQTTGQQILAAALRGRFPSWFAGISKPVREGSGEELPGMIEEAAESRMVVIGDTDFAASTYIQAVRSQRNLDLAVKILDWLGTDDDIISIRSRETASGRLDRITDPEKRLERMAQARFITVFAVPALVIAAGIFAGMRRRKFLAADGRSADASGKTGRKNA